MKMAAMLNAHRNRVNVFGIFNDRELIRRYRLDRAGIMVLVEHVRDAITSPTNRRNPISPEAKMVTTLRYLATGKMQLCGGDELGLSQPSVSRIIHQTLNALTRPHLIAQYIQFPLAAHQLQQNQAEFMNVAGLPGIVGAVDCTHVRIIGPSVNEPAYVNRKKYHSINVQVSALNE